MSEYQYVAFRAIDEPVSKKNLAYMRRQSTRAHITPWTFENEYNFGDFHGNAFEMMRRGYDIHLHYANFGIRKLLVHLPAGLPDPKAAKPYLDRESLRFRKDKNGPGGTLVIEPYYEGGNLEELWDIDKVLNRLVPLRSEILAGDLRPLYLAHLAVARDDNHDPDDTAEAPVPAGLEALTHAQLALARFFEVGSSLVAAAAQKSEPAPTVANQVRRFAAWVASRPEPTKDAWLLELLSDTGARTRSTIRAQFEKTSAAPSWPTVLSSRRIVQLEAAAKVIRRQKKEAATAKAEQERASRLAKMAADPTPFLRKAEKLVAQRTTESYEQVAQLLVDLRDALAGTKKSNLAAEHARKLKQANPTLNLLTAALRRHGFVPKR
jgi:hypothetical protein